MKVLSITSGKGGVGKTTLALNIARQLSLTGLRTLMIDFDIHNKGVTGLFSHKVTENSPSVISIVHQSNKFRSSLAPSLAEKTALIPLDEKGEMFLLPSAKPREMIEWHRFVADNATIVEFFQAFIRPLASKHAIDVVVIDCYGGIDTLTVAATGIADDTILINEPDVVTFFGTLTLYSYLSRKYEALEKKPHIHFVINRITGRHTFRFLDREYKKHLSTLAIDRKILAYFHYDRLILEAFGDYPFFSEILPRSLLTRKIQVLLYDLWGKEYSKAARFSRRKRTRIHGRTKESEFADPESILRAVVTAPFWLTVPAAILFFLAWAPVPSLSYNTIRFAYYFSVLLISFTVFTIGVFEPFQLARWLLRGAHYQHRRRRLGKSASRAYMYLASLGNYTRILVPTAFLLFVVLGFIGFYHSSRPWYPFRDVSIWRGGITGLRPGRGPNSLRNYRNLKMAPGAWIDSAGERADLQYTDFSYSQLRLVKLGNADLRYAKIVGAQLQRATLTGADLSQANLEQVNLLGAYLEDTVLNGTRLVEADLRGAYMDKAILRAADLSAAYLDKSRLPKADLTGAILKSTGLKAADLSGAILQNAQLNDADLENTILRDADLRGAFLGGANLTRADLAGADLRNADLRGTVLVGTNFQGARLQGVILRSDPDIGQTEISDELLAMVASLGASLDNKQRQRVSRWTRASSRAPQPPRLVAELFDAGKRLDISIRRERARLPKTFRPGSESFLHIAHSLIEHLIIRGQKGDLDEARMLLKKIEDESHEKDLYLLLNLLLTIVEDGDDVAAGQDWCNWVRDYKRQTPWSWETWDSSFPYDRYALHQREKIRAVQLAALGELPLEILCRRYFSKEFTKQSQVIQGPPGDPFP